MFAYSYGGDWNHVGVLLESRWCIDQERLLHLSIATVRTVLHCTAQSRYIADTFPTPQVAASGALVLLLFYGTHFMGAVRASNVERGRWRDSCREALAQHICGTQLVQEQIRADLCAATRLGIAVQPAEVRLKPSPDSAYRWMIVQGKEHLLAHLFSKSISEHSVSAYKELCAGVGKVFEAVAPTEEISDAIQTAEGFGRFESCLPKGVDMSFSAQIARLEEYNYRLNDEAEEVKRQLSIEAQRRQEAETMVEQLRQANHCLQEKYDKASSVAESYVRVLQKQFEGLSAVMPVLEEMKQTVSTCSSGVELWHKMNSSAGQANEEAML